MKKPFSKLSVLISSCDNYCDLWNPFFTLFWRYWPDCPYPVFLGSNHRSFDDKRVRTIRVGPDKAWGSNLLFMLDEIESEHILIFLDDFFLVGPIRNEAITSMLHIARQYNLGCLRLGGLPVPFKPLPGHENLGEFEIGFRGRVVTQVAIWKKSVLDTIILAGFSPWDFEAYGYLLAEKVVEPFWGVCSPIIDYHHAVEQGRWRDIGREVCFREGMNIDFSVRGCISDTEIERKKAILINRPRARISRFIPNFMRRLVHRRRLRKFGRNNYGSVHDGCIVTN